MKINVLVNTKARKRKIDKIDDSNYTVWVKSEPKNNTANSEVTLLLAAHFNTDCDKIKIIKGQKLKKKVIIIDN